MSRALTLTLLLIAAILEAGGDALIRVGLRADTTVSRAAMLGLGGLVLFAYGNVVNLPRWDFGQLLGAYVVMFFLVAQAISWLLFHQPPGMSTLIGGAFICIGGLIISVW